jgi:hypothetical protein
MVQTRTKMTTVCTTKYLFRPSLNTLISFKILYNTFIALYAIYFRPLINKRATRTSGRAMITGMYVDYHLTLPCTKQ